MCVPVLPFLEGRKEKARARQQQQAGNPFPNQKGESDTQCTPHVQAAAGVVVERRGALDVGASLGHHNGRLNAKKHRCCNARPPGVAGFMASLFVGKAWDRWQVPRHALIDVSRPSPGIPTTDSFKTAFGLGTSGPAVKKA